MSEALVLEQAHEPTLAEELATLDEELFEFVNLREEHTGIEGVIYVSTAVGAHGPRVKYFVRAGRDQPSFSVSIAAEPRVLANSLPQRELVRSRAKVIAWVQENHEALARFWDHGDGMTPEELAGFVAGLERV